MRGEIMRKYFLVGFTLFLFGCEADVQKVESEENKSTDTRIESKDVEILEGAYLAEDIKVDVTGDGEEDQILMYVSPPPMFDDHGDAAWDDSHVWQLVVKDEKKSYPLFDESLHFGTLDFWIVEKEHHNELLLFSEGQSLLMYRYTFNNDGFDKKEILSEEVNIVERSLSQW